MKHSKLFLGITTCLLAVVAVAAAKAHKFTKQTAGWFGTRNGTCGHQSVRSIYFTKGTGTAETKFNSINYPVYSKNVGVTSACPTPALLHTTATD